MTNPHEPTPEFERFLEWQVTSAVRRQARFVEPPRPAFPKHLGIAAVVLVSMLAGAAGVTAAGRIQTSERTRSLLAQQANEVLLAQMQVDVAKRSAELAKRQADVGMATEEAATGAELSLRQAELSLKRASLGTEEIAASDRAVQDDLSAPLVRDRDFVSERLALDQESARLLARAAGEKFRYVKTRFAVGLAGEVEVADAQAEMTRAAVKMRTAVKLAELRKQFLAGTIKTDALNNQRLLAATASELEIAESDLAIAVKRHAALVRRAAAGAAGEVDVLKAKVEMLTRQQDVAELKARIKTLEGR